MLKPVERPSRISTIGSHFSSHGFPSRASGLLQQATLLVVTRHPGGPPGRPKIHPKFYPVLPHRVSFKSIKQKTIWMSQRGRGFVPLHGAFKAEMQRGGAPYVAYGARTVYVRCHLRCRVRFRVRFMCGAVHRAASGATYGLELERP